jgi:hypothetical protein
VFYVSNGTYHNTITYAIGSSKFFYAATDGGIPIFCKIPGFMAHNVPAVCDGLAARIRKCVAFPGPTNCAGAMAWEWSVAE